MSSLVLSIEGMTCVVCTEAVDKAVKTIPGVTFASTSISTNTTSVTFKGPATSSLIVEAIEDAGYGATILDEKSEPKQKQKMNHHAKFAVNGDHISDCSEVISKALEAISELSFSISPTTNSFLVTFADPMTTSKIENILKEAGIHASLTNEDVVPQNKSPKRRSVLNVEGMTKKESESIQSMLLSTNGITSVNVDFATNQAVIEYEDRLTSAKELKDKVETTGLSATVVDDIALFSADDHQLEENHEKRLQLIIRSLIAPLDDDFDQGSDGREKRAERPPENIKLTPDLVKNIKTKLGQVPGVLSVDVKEADLSIILTFDETMTGPRAFDAALRSLNVYTKVSLSGGFLMAEKMAMIQKAEENERLWEMVWSVIFGLPVVVIILGYSTQNPSFVNDPGLHGVVYRGVHSFGVIICILTTPIQFYVGRRYHIRAWQSVRNGYVGMDFLVSVGTSAAFLYAFVGLCRNFVVTGAANEEVYEFLTPAVLISLLAVGKYMEAYAKGFTARCVFPTI